MTTRAKKIEEALRRMDAAWLKCCDLNSRVLAKACGYDAYNEMWDATVAARKALALPADAPTVPAWTMQGCPECLGTGKEGTGQPSDEGGEAFRACEGCNGSGLEPSCPGCGHPREWHERENWGGECIADGCACVHARET